MSARIAVIHTTAMTIAPLGTLIKQKIADSTIVNMLDDSILPQLITNGGKVADVSERIVKYAEICAQQGADIILFACSSVGDVAELAAQAVPVPVLRIDEAMMDEAVESTSRIGVAATLATTLDPSVRFLKQRAAVKNKTPTITTALAEGAFQCLAQGDREGHDNILRQTLLTLAENVDVIVLAQASMAGVAAQLEGVSCRFLTSPQSGIERLQQRLAEGE